MKNSLNDERVSAKTIEACLNRFLPIERKLNSPSAVCLWFRPLAEQAKLESFYNTFFVFSNIYSVILRYLAILSYLCDRING